MEEAKYEVEMSKSQIYSELVKVLISGAAIREK